MASLNLTPGPINPDQPYEGGPTTPGTPLKTQDFPWTDDEINDVRQFSQQWRAEHGVTQGQPGDLEIAYENLRQQGFSHDDARQGAINVLGWQGDTAAAPSTPAAETPAPSAPSGGGGYSPATIGDAAAGTGNMQVGGPFVPSYTPPPPPPSSLPRDTGNGYSVPAYVPPTPVFTPPTYTPPPAFSYADYQPGAQFSYGDYAPTTAADLTADPSYQFRVGEGLQALTNSAAARGVLNTGGTLKDFLNYGQNAASQEFAATDARRLQDYSTNRANAFGTWSANDAANRATYTTNRAGAVDTYNTNYGTQYQDPYKIAYQSAVDQFTPQMTAYQTQAAAGQHEADQQRSYDYNTWLQQYNMWRNTAQDEFDRQYKITALQ